MLAALFNAPGETVGARTQGSSEAIMLGALSLKWKWRKRREAAGKSGASPNLVFGGDVHVVWGKFCRYFDVEPRIVPLQQKYTSALRTSSRTWTRTRSGWAAVLGTTFTGQVRRHRRDQRSARRCLRVEKGSPRPAACGRRPQRRLWCGRSSIPTRSGTSASAHVHSINVSGRQVRARVSRRGLVDLPRARADLERGPGLLRELPRK